jgi:hypothetical protein
MHVTEETANVYRAAGRRWLTREGAYRAAAKQAIRRDGEETSNPELYQAWIKYTAAEMLDSDDIERRNQDAAE